MYEFVCFFAYSILFILKFFHTYLNSIETKGTIVMYWSAVANYYYPDFGGGAKCKQMSPHTHSHTPSTQIHSETIFHIPQQHIDGNPIVNRDLTCAAFAFILFLSHDFLQFAIYVEQFKIERDVLIVMCWDLLCG